MKKLFFIPAVLLCLCAAAQKDKAAKYAGIITGEALKKQLTIIASDEFEGRETGTEGQRKAAAYIEGQFEAMGLKKPAGMKSYQQFYPLQQDSLLQTTLKINDSTAVYGKDFYAPLAQNENMHFTANELVFAGYGIADSLYDDYAAINVKGKAVILFLGEPKREGKYFINPAGRSSAWTYPGIAKKLAAAMAKGAVGVLVVNPAAENFNDALLQRNKKSGLSFTSMPQPAGKQIDFAVLSHAFAKNIFPVNFEEALLKAKTNEAFTAQPTNSKTNIDFTFTKAKTIVNASNVIGIIEGTTKKDEYLLLTGHYDHLGTHDGKIYYGADDDGSGTCAVIQMAAAFSKAAAAGVRPKRTLVFMTVSGEEKGLWGSEYYSDHPVFPLEKTSADLNTDMIGRLDTDRKTADSLNYVYVVGHDKLSSELPLINEAANKKYTGLVLDYKFDDANDPNRIYFRSDHYNFARKGVPVLFFYDGMLKADYHKPTDTVDKINFSLYEKRAKMIFHTAWQMANMDGMLKRDKPLPTATR